MIPIITITGNQKIIQINVSNIFIGHHDPELINLAIINPANK